MWGGPEGWNTMKRERQTDRQRARWGQGAPRCQTCEGWRVEAILAVNPPATPVDATCSKEVSGWAPLRFLNYKIMSKINSWFKPLCFGILSYVTINNWNKTYRNREIINTFHKSNTCNLHQNQETEYCQHLGSCFWPIPVMASMSIGCSDIQNPGVVWSGFEFYVNGFIHYTLVCIFCLSLFIIMFVQFTCSCGLNLNIAI